MKLRLGSTASIALAALTMSATSANAGLLVDAAESCDQQSLSQPFKPWLDFANYTPLGGGDFESAAAGWTLSGGAAVASGNETFYVAGAGDASSLSVPAGAVATSPVICVGIEHPTIRFFAKRTAVGPLGQGSLRVDVLFENNLGVVSSLSIGTVGTTAGVWQPTVPMTVIANLLPLLSGDHTAVAFRFTAQLGGSFSIDDIQVDPYQRK
ncbi:hypothetical protein [Lapillicoccus sp.]|uniref:hypothetical protein n=1 Tax=Lapillicoccus sp. TaxID=1909287 RepID=UPI00398386B7